ncbi:MAG: M28 family peptidase [Deinococcus sp.]|nr:M28 family peptidase [Deinococcus sp.]
MRRTALLFLSLLISVATAQLADGDIRGFVLDLAEGIGIRAAGTAGERAAADYLEQRFREFGYQTELQPFPFTYFQDLGSAYQVGQGPEVNASTLGFSPPAELSAPLVFANLGRIQDLRGREVQGRIVLLRRGEIPFLEKAQNAARAGAVAIMVFNNRPGGFDGTYGQPGPLPGLALSRSEGEDLLDRLQAGEVLQATLSINTTLEERTSQNVIARWPTGTAHLVVGGHYDSVAQGPGANDNASGTAVVLALAQAFAGTPVAEQTIFVAFGAEEEGLLGSQAFVSALPGGEPGDITAMIDIDQIAVGNTLFVGGTPSLVNLTREVFGNHEGMQYLTELRAASDHVPFQNAGIPVLVLNRQSDPNNHTALDTVIEPGTLSLAAELVAAVLRELAGEGNTVEL